MNYATIQDWRDALATIATEKLPDYIVKSPEMYEDTIDIFLPDQDQKERPFMSVEVEPAGKIKRDRIRIFVGYRTRREYEKDEQFTRNIARVVAEVRAEHDKAQAEEKARVEREKAEKERTEILQKIAVDEVQVAFIDSKHEGLRGIEGNHKGGFIYLDFPKIKDEDGFGWFRRLELEYRADKDNKLTWTIGKDMRVRIPDLAAFAKTIY